MAVANALPAVKERADFVTRGDHGAGVVELIDELLGERPRRRASACWRGTSPARHGPDGAEVRVRPTAVNLLVAGPSGSGKSTVTTGLLERMAEAGYQFCVIDPEGDYSDLEERRRPRRPPSARRPRRR